jgi:predicted TIM-barrel enzyme
MKKLILSIVIVFSVSTYSQTNTVEKTKEAIPQDVAVFVDTHLKHSEVLKSLQPNDIESMNVVKRDTIIDSKKYKGQIFIKMKKK